MRSAPDDIIEEGTSVTRADTGFSFTEGPACAPDGRVFFTDQPKDRIYSWSETSGTRLFVEGCERSNGTFFDSDGNLLACAELYNRIVKFTPQGKIVILLAGGYGGRHLNGPNDLWPDTKGGIFFTDPYFQRDYWEKGHKEEQDVRGVYYLTPGGDVQRVISDFKQPNGLIGTPDGKILFAADQGSSIVWRYTINDNGTLTDKEFFAAGRSDGMTIDNQGNVYISSKTVEIFNPTGKKKGEITLPETPSNLTFGGIKRDILFITARTSIYTLKMKVRGVY
jgi:gluconolactonase